MESKGKQKHSIALIAIVAVLAITAIFGVNAYQNSPTRRVREAIDLGNQYLIELKYEEAITSFKNALEIEPLSEDAMERIGVAYTEYAVSVAGVKEDANDSAVTSESVAAGIEIIDSAVEYLNSNSEYQNNASYNDVKIDLDKTKEDLLGSMYAIEDEANNNDPDDKSNTEIDQEGYDLSRIRALYDTINSELIARDPAPPQAKNYFASREELISVYQPIINELLEYLSYVDNNEEYHELNVVPDFSNSFWDIYDFFDTIDGGEQLIISTEKDGLNVLSAYSLLNKYYLRIGDLENAKIWWGNFTNRVENSSNAISESVHHIYKNAEHYPCNPEEAAYIYSSYYDEFGRLIEYDYEWDNYIFRYYYSYGEGNSIIATRYETDSPLYPGVTEETYEYDDKGIIISAHSTSFFENQTAENSYTYQIRSGKASCHIVRMNSLSSSVTEEDLEYRVDQFGYGHVIEE